MPFLYICSFFIIFLFLIQIESYHLHKISFEEAISHSNQKFSNFSNINLKSNSKIFFSDNRKEYYDGDEETFNDPSIKLSEITDYNTFLDLPSHFLLHYEKNYKKELANEIIKNKFSDKSSKNSVYFSEEHSFYGYTKKMNLNNEFSYFRNSLIKKNTKIKEITTSPLKDIIATEPQEIITEAKTCVPKSRLFYIINPDTEDNLIIKDIKTDLYQIKIFPIIQKIENNYNNKNQKVTSSINSYFPYSIFPQSNFVFQLLILVEDERDLTGNLYIKFNDKKILIVPIYIHAKENEYQVSAIYHPKWLMNMKMIDSIKITNPYNKKLIINDISFSFEKLKLEWPNDKPITNNLTQVQLSMLEIKPLTTKVIIKIKYESFEPHVEYGFVHLFLSDEENLVIPIFINTIKRSFNVFPSVINFGLCQVKTDEDITKIKQPIFKKIIPLIIGNDDHKPLEVKKIYLDHEDNYIHFQQNEKATKSLTYNRKELYGNFIFDGEFYDKNFDKKIGMQEGKIFIETNSNINPLIELKYFYMLDNNKIQTILSPFIYNMTSDVDKVQMDVNLRIKRPLGFMHKNYLFTNNRTIVSSPNNDYTGIITKVENNKEFFDIKININMSNLQKDYHRYFIFPLKITDQLHSSIPIVIDNQKLEIFFCHRRDKVSLPICMRNSGKSGINKDSNPTYGKSIIVGATNNQINLKNYFYIANDNFSPIIINDITLDNLKFSIDLVKVESLTGYKNHKLNASYENLKGKLPNMIHNLENKSQKSSNFFTLYPKTSILFSINFKTAIYSESIYKNTLSFIYNENKSMSFTTIIQGLLGDINVFPGNIKFKSTFPGLDQTQTIFCKNTYSVDLKIYEVKSNDERIVPVLLNSIITPNNKTEVIQILFQPEKNFLNGNSDLDFKKSLTYKELYLWKQKIKYWKELENKGKTEINANVTLVTNLKNKVINVRSFLIKPNIVKKEEINYGVIQLGSISEQYIELYNPSDSPVFTKILLADEEFADLSDYSMFNIQDKQEILLNKKNILLLGCSFVLNKNNSLIQEYEYIVINEDINLNNINKNDLLKKLYNYGNDNVKKYLIDSYNVLCTYEKKEINDIIQNSSKKNEYLIHEVFSSEFNEEIGSVKNMTSNIQYINSSNLNNKKNFLKKYYNTIKDLFTKIFNIIFFKNCYFPDVQLRELSQSFYLSNNIADHIYKIEPQQNLKVGPILFKPNKIGNISSVILLKNNLTVIYPIKLHGEGGSGKINFISRKSEIFNNTNFIIEINKNTFINEMKYLNTLPRTITILNSGNLLMNIKNITVDNSLCQTQDIIIKNCHDEISLNPGEKVNINIEIKTNFANYITNKVLKFNTEYQTFELDVIIIVSKELLEHKNFYYNPIFIFAIIVIPLSLIAIIVRFIYKIINSSKKNEEAEKFIDHIENENKNKEQNINTTTNNSYRKKTKNKKNNKKSESSNSIANINDNKKINKNQITDEELNKYLVKKTKDIITNVANEGKNSDIKESVKNKEHKNEKAPVNTHATKRASIDSSSNNEISSSDATTNEIIINNNDAIINNSYIKIINKNNPKDTSNKTGKFHNNINIKININLNTKKEEEINSIIEKKDNIIEDKSPSNFINNNLTPSPLNNNLTPNSKTKKAKAINKTKLSRNKKVSNLNELFGMKPKQKKNLDMPDTTSAAKSTTSPSTVITSNTISEQKLSSLAENNQNNRDLDDLSKNNESQLFNKKNEDIFDYDFPFFKQANKKGNKNEEDEEEEEVVNEGNFDMLPSLSGLDFFDIFNKDDKKNIGEEKEDGHDLFENQDTIDYFYENPFCNEDKKGKLDDLINQYENEKHK